MSSPVSGLFPLWQFRSGVIYNLLFTAMLSASATFHHPGHSALKFFTGFAIAVFIACALTDNNAVNKANPPEAMRNQEFILIR